MAFFVPQFGSMAVAGPIELRCPGDCNVDRRVDVSELVEGVGILLGQDSLGVCPALDSNDDSDLRIDELVTAIERSLHGCREPSTPTQTSIETPTATPTAIVGPEIVFFGVTLSDDSPQDPAEMKTGEPPVYALPFGSGFSLVVEASSDSCSCSPDCECLGSRTFDAPQAPDLQIQTTRELGNGSAAVCDASIENLGGVPAVDPPRFDDSPEVVDVLNDLGCRFLDGDGLRTSRDCSEACIQFDSGEYGCRSPDARAQFCGFMTAATAFPPGDTLVSARVRDIDGNAGPIYQLVIRVGPFEP